MVAVLKPCKTLDRW